MKYLTSIYRFFSPKFQSIHLDYPVKVHPRYGHGKPPHKKLYSIINSNRDEYKILLDNFLSFLPLISVIKDVSKETDENKPTWNNGFLPGLDIITLYSCISYYKPSKYIEVGSGNSTKVARKAIQDNKLQTEIISIDPHPRANIDHLSDKVMRIPFENLDNYSFITDTLQENDILFIDNSHRSFPNSDVTIFFLEILPKLNQGVIVHIHDIYLPYDYPQFMCDRYYNEQYLLASYLLANSDKYFTILPNYFISQDKELNNILTPFWQQSNMPNVEHHGGSFWLKIK